MPGDNFGRFKVKVNDFEFSFTQEEIEGIELVRRSESVFHLLHAHRSVTGVLIAADPAAKKQVIEIEGEKFEVVIVDELDQTLDQLGFNSVAATQIKEIKAPMPGMVLEVAVAEGQKVQEGDKILILVAMKMENAILIHTEATIKRIAVKAGEAVEKGQVLVELE